MSLNFEKCTLMTGFVVQGHTHTHIYISVVKRLIGINRIQIKSFCLHNICMCTLYVYYVYVYFEYTYMYLCSCVAQW